MSKVIKDFKCKITKKVYRVGSEYNGDRLEELQEKGYVEKTKTPEFPKHVGGGVYELSNGEKIKGKEAAIAEQAKIDASKE